MSQSPKTPFGDTTKAVIAHHFGRWTAYSALRSGKHVKWSCLPVPRGATLTSETQKLSP